LWRFFPLQVVIDAFRLINPQMILIGQEPRQTTSNIGFLNKPSIQARIHGLNTHYYSISINYRKNELEQKMLQNLHKRVWGIVYRSCLLVRPPPGSLPHAHETGFSHLDVVSLESDGLNVSGWMLVTLRLGFVIGNWGKESGANEVCNVAPGAVMDGRAAPDSVRQA
jgi:hypothetical protein